MAGLDSRFVLMFPLQEYFVDKNTGLPLAGGIVTFYEDSSRSILKPVYTISGSYPNYTYVQLPNPLTLSAVGTPMDGSGNDIIPYLFPYDGTPSSSTGTIDLYYITVTNSMGQSQFTRQAWPNLTSSSSPTSSSSDYNYIRNGDFFSWGNGTDFTNVGTGSSSVTDFILNDWTYSQDDSTQTIEIKRSVFSDPGQSIVPGNPRYYLTYNNTNVGSNAGTHNYFQQTYNSSATLSGQTVMVDLWVFQTVGVINPITISFTQNFGSGGSTTFTTTPVALTPSPITNSWVQMSAQITIPSITGKTVGAGDYLSLNVNMPLNIVATIGISQARLRQSTTLTSYQEISPDDSTRKTNYVTLYPPFSTGDVKMTIKTAADIGWLMMDDGTIGNSSSGASHTGLFNYNLYTLIWNNILNATSAGPVYVPIYNSDGTVGTKGASASADWGANKRLSLTRVLGRVLAGANPTPTPMFNLAFTASEDGSNNLLISVGTGFTIYTGYPIRFSTGSGGTLPTGISAGTTYYAVMVTANTFNVAISLANAIAGSVIAWTNNGTAPYFVFDYINVSHPLASYLGEEAHGLTTSEIPSHTHTPSAGNGQVVGVTAGGAGSTYGSGNIGTGANIQSTGGSGAHNNIQPTTYMNVMIKL